MFGEQKSGAIPSTIDTIDGLHCPITRERLKDPVVDEHGHTFERKAIKQWVEEKRSTCPLTNQPINPAKLVPNYALKDSLKVIPIIEEQEKQLRDNSELIKRMRDALNDNQKLLIEAKTQLDHANEGAVLEDWEAREAFSCIRGRGCFSFKR
jgi:hypothetical protein